MAAYNQNYGGVQPQSYHPQQQYQQQQQLSHQNFNGSQYGGSQSPLQQQPQPMQQQQFGGQVQPSYAPQSFQMNHNQGFDGPQNFGSTPPQGYGGGGGAMHAMGGGSPNTQGTGVSSLFGNPNVNGGIGATFGGTPPVHPQQQPVMNGPYGGGGDGYNNQNGQHPNGHPNWTNTQIKMEQQSTQSPPQQMHGGSGGVMFNGGGGGSPSTNWDGFAQKSFTQQMTQRIRQIIGYQHFGTNAGQITRSINEASDALLQSMKPNFKYVSHTLLMPNGAAYHMGHQLHIQPVTDVCITVKVELMNITAILEAYCLSM